ncbi:MAG: tetratricopeptide repeat protein, partial [Microcystaceae cyanobacterium]
RKLNPEQQVKWFWQNWRPTKGLVLVVLDDVTSLKSCQKLLPPKSNRFRTLMTTRLRRIETNFVEISLDVLSAEDALIFLTKVLGEQDQRVKQESRVAESLCAWLGYLPLGLELVGRYLVEDPDLSLAEMLQRLKAQQLQDEAINPTEEQLQDTEMTAKRGVKAAFELSWRELNQKTQCVGELLSLFASDVIPWELVELTSKSLNWVESDVKEAKKQLYRLHLIQRLVDGDSGYKIHPLIQEFLRYKPNKKLKYNFCKVMVKLAKEILDLPTQEIISSFKDTIPHLIEVAQNLTDAISSEDLIPLFSQLGKFYKGQGFYAMAQPLYKQCVSVVEFRLGKEHLDYAISLNNLANIHEILGDYKKAETLYEQALELIKKVLGEEHPDYATSLSSLANIYYSQGRYEEAEPLWKQALELIKRVLGEEHPDYA